MNQTPKHTSRSNKKDLEYHHDPNKIKPMLQNPTIDIYLAKGKEESSYYRHNLDKHEAISTHYLSLYCTQDRNPIVSQQTRPNEGRKKLTLPGKIHARNEKSEPKRSFAHFPAQSRKETAKMPFSENTITVRQDGPFTPFTNSRITKTITR